MSRVELSHRAVARVAAHLRRLGHHVAQPDTHTAVLLVDGRTTLHVFVASWYMRRHRVVVGGKARPAADYTVLATAGAPIRDAFVVPADVMAGRLVYELVGEGAHRRSIVAGYRGAFGLIRHRQRRAA